MRTSVFGDAMVGLEEWKFPTEFFMIDGDTVVVKWQQVIPGRRADGSAFAQSGYSTLVYAGDGKFRYEEDLLNMAHVMEDVARERIPLLARDGLGAGASEPRLLALSDQRRPSAALAATLSCALVAAGWPPILMSHGPFRT